MNKKTYYHTCKICGANLDPGELCDCINEKTKTEKEKVYNYKISNKNSNTITKIIKTV